MELTPRVCVIVEVIDHAIVNMDLEPDTEPGFFWAYGDLAIFGTTRG